jgi:hypothetical protein
MSEKKIQAEILNKLARGPVRLFRQNVGVAWHGREVIMKPAERMAIILDPRPIHCGLVKGSGDLIGWRSVTITPDMVGKKVAVFSSLEVKGPHGRGTKEQRAWADAVRAGGGRAGFARSVDDARCILGVDSED